jgi:hypothetical protein
MDDMTYSPLSNCNTLQVPIIFEDCNLPHRERMGRAHPYLTPPRTSSEALMQSLRDSGPHCLASGDVEQANADMTEMYTNILPAAQG